ncbi:hypothetical protein AALO_G00163050 [Alosa alosa]|uniref:G-protein coupled receptors family 1 profile domain-containing protein n=1 Tax=Alosa alosa TaxID=278164 RepID=A0AAV6GCG7_9TELE|nr:atypical chemokine receptor 2 [Alosa alosa]KAG5272229.1 hypothetical protein AALO_G00163050 [Alosa alosa]
MHLWKFERDAPSIPLKMDEQTDFEYLDYSEYYDDHHIESFGLCDNTYLKEFAKKFLPAVYSIVAILGTLANAVLIIIFIKYAAIRKIPPLCTTISDLLFGATLPFFAVYAQTNQWIFGQSACKIITYLYTTTLYSSNFSLAFMSLDKYYSVFGGFCSVRIIRISVKCMAFFLWIFSLLAAIPHAYFAETHEHDGHQICTYHHVSTWRTVMKFEENIAGFVVPLIIMSVCSAQISYYMVKKFPNNTCGLLRQELAYVVTFLILWLPYSVVVFLHALQELHILMDCTTHQNLQLAVMLTESLAFMHVFVNPVVYAFQNKRVRKLFRMARSGTAEFLIESSENLSAVELTAVHTTGIST